MFKNLDRDLFMGVLRTSSALLIGNSVLITVGAIGVFTNQALVGGFVFCVGVIIGLVCSFKKGG